MQLIDIHVVCTINNVHAMVMMYYQEKRDWMSKNSSWILFLETTLKLDFKMRIFKDALP